MDLKCYWASNACDFKSKKENYECEKSMLVFCCCKIADISTNFIYIILSLTFIQYKILI